MSIKTILKRLGFSKNEILVYHATLELGISSAQKIAKKAGIKRTTAYPVLNTLIDRGVVSKTKEKEKTRFLAEPPQKLLFMLNEIHHDLKKALPELNAIHNRHELKPKIIFFEGEDAITAMYNDTLKEKPKEILMWLTDLYFENFIKNENYIAMRVKHDMHARRIGGSGSTWHRKNKPNDKKELSETIIVPRDYFWPGIEVNIYNDKVVFTNFTEKMCVIIENKTIADAMRQVYELSWLGAKTIEVKET
jgi:sugar-specific transcriptional regulator TrmB